MSRLTYFLACLILFTGIITLPACSRSKCPANGGYVDAPKKVNKRRHKPSSGLWDKKMDKGRKRR